jgi:hypothetical protein
MANQLAINALKQFTAALSVLIALIRGVLVFKYVQIAVEINFLF